MDLVKFTDVSNFYWPYQSQRTLNNTWKEIEGKFKEIQIKRLSYETKFPKS